MIGYNPLIAKKLIRFYSLHTISLSRLSVSSEFIPTIYPRSQHPISRSSISSNVLTVLYRLKREGFQSYLVGGCVRDLLLGREPKDFDVVTNARPEQIRSIFWNCRLIGKRFRLAHVQFGREIVEVATFRRPIGEEESSDHALEDGRILYDNVYGASIEEDVLRRDFTVNALYYNIADFSIVDYVGGVEDNQASLLRIIGDPEQRYREDPVRMLRAIRLAVKLGFVIEPRSASPISHLAHLLKAIPPARLYDEVVKLFLSGYAVQTFEQLRQYHLFEALFPDTERCLAEESDGFPLTFLAKALERTDERIQERKFVTAYFLFAVLLWEPVRKRVEARRASGVPAPIAYQEVSDETLYEQSRFTSFPRALSLAVRDVWTLQPAFEKTQGIRVLRLLKHTRFRASFDFFVLRAETGEAEPGLADWWGLLQSVSEPEQVHMVQAGYMAKRKVSRRKSRLKKKNHLKKHETPT